MEAQRDRIRAFVATLLREAGYESAVKDDESLIMSGLIDSLSVIQIVAFMEKEFHADFSETYFDQGDFDTIEDMASFLAKLPAAEGRDSTPHAGASPG